MHNSAPTANMIRQCALKLSWLRYISPPARNAGYMNAVWCVRMNWLAARVAMAATASLFFIAANGMNPSRQQMKALLRNQMWWVRR